MVQDFIHPQLLKHITLRCRAKILRVKDGEFKAEFKVYPADVMTAGTTVQAKMSQGMFPNLGKAPKHGPYASRHLGLWCRGGFGFRCLRFVSFTIHGLLRIPRSMRFVRVVEHHKRFWGLG